MKAVARAFHPISLDHVLEGSRIELRIHGYEPRGDAPTLLDADEARALADALRIMADRLDRVPMKMA
jgi:hypothetical protein